MEKPILVTAAWCPGCKMVKEILKKKGISYNEIDADTKNGNEFCNKNRIMELPTLLVNGKKMDVEKFISGK